MLSSPTRGATRAKVTPPPSGSVNFPSGIRNSSGESFKEAVRAPRFRPLIVRESSDPRASIVGLVKAPRTVPSTDRFPFSSIASALSSESTSVIRPEDDATRCNSEASDDFRLSCKLEFGELNEISPVAFISDLAVLRLAFSMLNKPLLARNETVPFSGVLPVSSVPVSALKSVFTVPLAAVTVNPGKLRSRLPAAFPAIGTTSPVNAPIRFPMSRFSNRAFTFEGPDRRVLMSAFPCACPFKTSAVKLLIWY